MTNLEELVASGTWTGYGRLIDVSDVNTLADQLQNGVTKFVADVGTSISAFGASLVSTVRSLGEGGTTLLEEKQVREKLQPVVDDPRVIHYLLLHSRGDLGRTGVSFVLSKATAGISASVEKGGSAATVAGLGAALGLLAKELAEENAALRNEAHSSAVKVDGTPPELIEAIASIAIHFGDASIVEGLKGIPFYVGTAVGLAQTVARKIGGTIDDAKQACLTVHFQAKKGQRGALRVAKLLGVPEEIVTSQGGEKAMIIRL